MNNENYVPSPGKKLIKVKRLKQKNVVSPSPEDPRDYAQPNNNQADDYRAQRSVAINNTPNIQTFIPDDPLQQARNNYNDSQNFYGNTQNADDEYDDSQSKMQMLLTEQPLKMVILASVVCFIVGFVLAMLTTSSSSGPAQEGLSGVIPNMEVPKGRARCGIVDRTQGCVMYIMNPQRQDLSARDFYDLAAQLTGRQRFVIDTANMRYSSTKIRPGAIAQLNIPPLQ